MYRVNLVERDSNPLGVALVDPDRSGKTTQYDLGNVVFVYHITDTEKKHLSIESRFGDFRDFFSPAFCI